MLRRKTGCLAKGITVLASDTDLEASKNKTNYEYLVSKYTNECCLVDNKVDIVERKSGAPGPGVPAGVLVRLLQCGAIVTWRSSSERFIKLFTNVLVLASGTLFLL